MTGTSSIARLNVGGKKFDVQKDTLIKGSSFFAAMFNGNMKPGETLHHRNFIDRSGNLFEDVVDYLRNLDQWDVPADPTVLLGLIREAEYFGLDGMIHKIKQRVPPYHHAFEVYFEMYHKWTCGSGYSEATPDAVRKVIDQVIKEPRDSKKSHIMIKTDPYSNLINQILATTNRNYDMKKIVGPTKDGYHLTMIFTERYDAPIYTALRERLYSSKN